MKFKYLAPQQTESNNSKAAQISVAIGLSKYSALPNKSYDVMTDAVPLH